MNIVVCPGHNATYKGVVNNGFTEFDIVEKITNLVNSKLLSEGHTSQVVLGTLIDKVNQINTINPDLAVEIHLGSSSKSEMTGSQSYFMMNKDYSKLLANCLLESSVRMLGSNNKGAWIGWYKRITPKMVEEGRARDGYKAKIDLFLSKIGCPSAIIEPFFISSAKDCKRYITDDKSDLIADSIVEGIKNYHSKFLTAELRLFLSE